MENELSPYQRGLIDNIIEETQYETAIDALFQVRSPSHKPSPWATISLLLVVSLTSYSSHVRQLVFLSLHSSKASLLNDSDHASVHASPRKSRPTKHTPITPKAVTSAQDLLASLVATNSPAALGRALPSYASHDKSQLASFSPDDEGDSLLAMQAQCIRTAKNCWEILEDGYIDRTQNLMSPARKTKTRSGVASNAISVSHLVGNDAWPLLEFLVALLERDEQCREKLENGMVSLAIERQLEAKKHASQILYSPARSTSTSKG
jgi:hypothetical protein